MQMERRHAESSNGQAGVVDEDTTFPFPFPPYPIQTAFMRNLYHILQTCRIGILESPTGTGKSMSLICGACKWLSDEQIRQRERMQQECSTVKHQRDQLDADNNGAGVDWLVADYEKLKLQEKLRSMQRQVEKIDLFGRNKAEIKRRAKIEWCRTEDEKIRSVVGARQRVRATTSPQTGRSTPEDDDDSDVGVDFLPEEPTISGEKPKRNADKLEDDDEDDQDAESDENNKRTKIFYCCRTHSQLSQFIEQIQKSPYADKFFVVPLASRQQLCVNPAVNKLKSQSAINDRCLELKDKGGERGCPFLANNLRRVKKLADRALAEPTEIEQLAAEGAKGKACSYYATRYAVRKAEIIVLPYNSIFHKPTRDALGLSLRGHVVIIDEAHNFTDAVAGVNSAQLNGQQLTDCLAQIDFYIKRYRDRLKSSNLLLIKQIRRITAEISKAVTPTIRKGCGTTDANASSFSLTLDEFKQRVGIIGSVNLCELLTFLEESRLSRKLNGFARMLAAKARKETDANHQDAEEPNSKRLKLVAGSPNKKTDAEPAPHSTTAASSPLIHIESFLRLIFVMSCNISLNDTVRIIVETGGSEGSSSAASDGILSTSPSLFTRTVRIVILNIAEHVRDILHDARSVIFAGGTMQPVDELIEHVLVRAGVARDRIEFRSYGHVVPQQNVCALTIGQGPTGQTMQFSYEQRMRKEVMQELALLLVQTVQVVPGGVVCFFPSYSYEDTFYKFISAATNDNKTFLSTMSGQKLVVREPHSSREVDEVLTKFSSAIAAARKGHSQLTGGILFAVVGGKLSEGINFADDLCRCVVMIGLPYPNRSSVELKEKLAFLDRQYHNNRAGKSAILPSAAHYEALCMKAVNQSIGRAIRHKDDYALMLLVDQRFCTKANVVQALPKWLLPSLVSCERGGFKQAQAEMNRFFETKK